MEEHRKQAARNRDAGLTRREVLRGAALAAAAVTSATPRAAAAEPLPGTVLADSPAARAAAARQLRVDAAGVHFAEAPSSVQAINGDEALYPDFRGSFSKTLEHTAIGEVEPAAYLSLLKALGSRAPDDFEAIRTGSPLDEQRNRLVSPQAAYAFELSGLDGNAHRIPPAPSFASSVTEAEMAELYWYAVTRDIPFIEYESAPEILAAADDLGRFSASRALFPVDGAGRVTPQTIFRARTWTGEPTGGLSPLGALDGPFVSQFLLKPFAVGALSVEQRYPRLARHARNQFLTTFGEWLAVQRGFDPNARGGATQFKPGTRYIATMRDLSEWVHRDFPLQAGLHALAVILGFGDDAAFDQSLPYLRLNSATQQGFVDFGVPDMSHLVAHGPRQALTGAWFQKWACHRRLRPEAYAARLNVQLRGLKSYGIGSTLLGSQAFARAADEVRRVNGTRRDPSNDGLLPMAFPEGCPAHPAYPGGHSSFVAASATILKAFVDEDYVIPDPVQADQRGQHLAPWTGADLTLGGELNKLVANVTHARDAAGMHWRSDGVGNLIGEAVGIALLRDYSRTYNQQISGLTLRRFDGRRIRITDGAVHYV